MSSPGTLAAGLAFVPNWWQETTDPAAFDSLLAGWVRASGWKSAGFAWPAEGANPTARIVQGPAVIEDRNGPAELADAARRIRGGESTVLFALANSGSRAYAAVLPPTRPLALLWADKTAGQTWTEAERAFVGLTAKAMERSPVVALLLGQPIDADRLAQRLADASVIAGRIAHDFGNVLTGIIGFSDLIGPMLPPGTPQAAYMAEIAKSGQKGITFTRQLQQFARSGETRPTPGSIAGALAREEARLRPVMHPALRIEKELPPNMPGVAVESEPLQVALGHLLENAVEACPQGGTIRITATPTELTEAEAQTYLGKVVAGPHLLLTLSDTGTGMKPEVRRRLFAEPFHTTKIKHRGLGLATVYRTLAAHRGGIKIEPVPAPATGTVVRVVFPFAAARPPALTVTPMPVHTPAPGVTRAVSAPRTTIAGG